MPATIFCLLLTALSWVILTVSVQFTSGKTWMNTTIISNSIKSVICQIDANCSPFQSLSMLPFHIMSERLKLIYYSLIPIFSKYHFKSGTLYFLFLSSHIFTALEVDNIYFGNIVRQRDHNEIKPTIEKTFQKYNLSRYYFVMSRK